jgi:hypothetical protein
MGAMTLKFDRRDQHALRRLRTSYHVLRHDAEAGFVTHEDVPAIVLDNGRLAVGNVPIHTAKFTADHITWRQQSPGRYSSGHLYVHNNGLSIHGAVLHGTSPADAVRHDVIGTVVKPVTYKTRITKQPYFRTQDPAGIPESDWSDGLELAITFELSVGASVPAPKVVLGGVDITPVTTWAVAANGNTVLAIVMDDVTCTLAPQLYQTARLSFDPYAPTPTGSGTVSALCSGGPPDSKVYFWTGKPVAQARQEKPLALERIAPADVVAAAVELKVETLMTILPDQQVSDDANSMLMRNMKWAMGQDGTERDWLSTFFGQTPPSIVEEDQIALIKQSVGWYQNDFAKAYMTQSFQYYSGPNAPTDHRLNGDQAKKLDEWFKTGLAATPDFTVQHRGIYVDAFRGVHQELNAFLNDGGEKWAKALFDVLTGGPQFVLMVNRVAGAAGDPAAMAPVNNFATLLTALQPSADYAKAYFKSVLTGVVNRVIPQSTHLDKSTILEWLPKAMEEMLRRFADGNIPEGAQISQQEAKEILQEYLKHQMDIATALADLLASIVASNLLQQTEKAEEGFESIAKRWPKLAKAAKLMFVLGWIGSLATLLATLIKGDWKNMSDVQKAQFVTEIAQAALQAFDAVPLMYTGVKSITIKVWQKYVQRINEPEEQIELQEIGDRAADGDMVEAAAEEMRPLLAEGAAEPGAFARIFAEGIVSGVVKILGAMAAVAMAGYTLWQLITDLKNGSISTIVFDSLIFAANLLSAVCLTVALFTVSTFFPIAGAVLAIAGVVLSMLAQFLEKPSNPVDDFMRDVGIPFVDALKLPKLPSPAFLAPAAVAA